MTPASARCVAIISGRFGRRTTSGPARGATTRGSASTKNTSPACAFDPVRTFAQIPRTMIIAQSPNIESVCPARSRRMSGREASAFIVLGGAEDPEVAADRLAAHDERRPVALGLGGIAAERNFRREIA